MADVMKVALLLTGQLRTFELCKHIIKNTICKHYDTDIFISVDSNNIHQRLPCNNKDTTTKDEIDSAVIFLNPVDHTVNTDNDLREIFRQCKKLKVPTALIKSMYRRFRQYYVVMNAYKMMKRHIETTGVQYDLIIRLRFDQFVWDSNINIDDTIPTINQEIMMNESNISIKIDLA
jgi:hypothetical protein